MNESGIYPILHTVLVEHITPEVNRGVIKLTDDAALREDMAQVEGIFVAAGPEAFKDQKFSRLPNEGDKVVFAKLSGFFMTGKDGKRYRVISDLDLLAVKDF